MFYFVLELDDSRIRTKFKDVPVPRKEGQKLAGSKEHKSEEWTSLEKEEKPKPVKNSPRYTVFAQEILAPARDYDTQANLESLLDLETLENSRRKIEEKSPTGPSVVPTQRLNLNQTQLVPKPSKSKYTQPLKSNRYASPAKPKSRD